jgi:hypothetical protein
MTEKYSPELVEKYLKEMKKKYPDTDLHLLEMAILQYIFLDCDENYKPDENNEEYLKAKNYMNKKNLILFY